MQEIAHVSPSPVLPSPIKPVTGPPLPLPDTIFPITLPISDHSEHEDSVQFIPAPSAPAEVITVPSHSLAEEPHREHDTAQSPHPDPLTHTLHCSDIDPSKLSSFTVTYDGTDSLPKLHTNGDPGTAAKVFTLLMNQLVTPVLAPPSPQLPHVPNSNPNTPTIAAETPPSRKRTFKMDSLRRSVRIRAQGGEAVPIMTKAQEVAQKRYHLRSGGKGNALLHNHPYARLTVKEVTSLFRAYHIQLGINDLNTPQIIQAIKILDRSDFDRMINQALDTLKSKDDTYCLVLDIDTSGVLTFQ